MGERTAEFASHEGNLAYLALGVALPYLEERGSRLGRERSLRTLDAVVTATALSEGLKLVTRERRPDGGDHKSFPSGHATAAFAVAAMEARYYPEQAPLWYAGAAVIAGSRVRLRRHYTQDVLAGASGAVCCWRRSSRRRSRTAAGSASASAGRSDALQ
jgi:membrane-associated phospholipid phosphatase